MHILFRSIRAMIVPIVSMVVCLSSQANTHILRQDPDTVEMPAFMASGAGYASVFTNSGYSVLVDDDVKAIVGWGRGLNGSLGAKVGRAAYLGMMVDYLWASFQNGLGHDGARWTGTATFWSVGPSLSFGVRGTWITASMSYLRQRYDWDTPRRYPRYDLDTPRRYPPDIVPQETHEGVRVQGHIIIPVTTIFGIHGGVRVDAADAIQPSFMLGIAFCNFMDILYLNKR